MLNKTENFAKMVNNFTEPLPVRNVEQTSEKCDKNVILQLCSTFEEASQQMEIDLATLKEEKSILLQ